MMTFMIYPIRLYGDPILRAKAKPITDFKAPIRVPGYGPTSLSDIAENMFDTMFEARGVGLAAPQVGLPIRMFVAAEYEDDEPEDTTEPAEKGKPKEKAPLRSRVLEHYVFINPKLEVITRKKDRSHMEGCLSIPGVVEDGVARLREVRIVWNDLEGKLYRFEFEDYMARVMQHEVDHLDGKLFLDHLPSEVVDDYRKTLLALGRQAKLNLQQLEKSAQTAK
jgi:peptide deformylase